MQLESDIYQKYTYRNSMISLIKRVSGGNHVRKCISRILDHRDLSAVTSKTAEISKLTEEERKKLLTPLLSCGWEIHPDRDAIYSWFRFFKTTEAFMFMDIVACEAEKMNHYPEWFYHAGEIKFILISHDINGLSQRDVKLATFISETFDFMNDSSKNLLSED